MRPLFLLLLIGMNLVWAATCPIYKSLAAHLDSGAIATLRFGLAALCLLAVWPWLPGRGPVRRDLWKALLMGTIVFCLAPRLQIEGVHRGMASDTCLLIALDPLIVALAAAVFLGEQIAPRRWWGFGLGMAGVVLLARVGPQAAQPFAGLLANVLFLTSFVCEAAYSVMGKPLLARCGSLKLLAAALLGGTVANLTWAGLAPGSTSFQALQQLPLNVWGWLAYMAVVNTVLGYALWYRVIRETEVNITGLTVFIQPVAGLIISVLWLDEPLHVGQFWGSLVIVLGLIIGLRPNVSGNRGMTWLRRIVTRGRLVAPNR